MCFWSFCGKGSLQILGTLDIHVFVRLSSQDGHIKWQFKVEVKHVSFGWHLRSPQKLWGDLNLATPMSTWHQSQARCFAFIMYLSAGSPCSTPPTGVPQAAPGAKQFGGAQKGTMSESMALLLHQTWRQHRQSPYEILPVEFDWIFVWIDCSEGGKGGKDCTFGWFTWLTLVQVHEE